ncbi:hypothetical protein NFI95_07260 [Acetobacteraceae bacterium KSS8]|uniref:DUF1835 domain-containing protein n=1 Tax=Endosaccharibacter trunci TaxID=2812733 RepID=A0ABT1W5T2_9PROT|nr:hypothetical protein [Acetobacteraceae bacterium KSS8]
MSALILVTCDSGAGHLKQEKRADRIRRFTHRLVAGPVPADGPPETFFQRQRALYEADNLYSEPHWFDFERPGGSLLQRIWTRLPDECRDHDRIELWIDPDPNAQLILVQLLDWLGALPDIAPRLWLKLSDSPLGERRPGDWVLPPRPVEAADLALARRAWSAFGAPTPESWSSLRDDPETQRLPGLVSAIERTLRELPDGTGLGATARRILALTEREFWWIEAMQRGPGQADRVLPEQDRVLQKLVLRTLRSGDRVPLWYAEIEQLICELAAAPVPALSGVTERQAGLDLFQDQDRQKRFWESPVRLTYFGADLVAGTEDWSRHNPVCRWLGGTRLTNDRLWRWETASKQLIAP